MKKIFMLNLFIVFSSTFYAQTAAEKVALGLCECSKEHDYASHVAILKSNNQEAIRADFENISHIFRATKTCAKRNVKLTREEGQKVPEKEIEAALSKNCEDVVFLSQKYREISAEIDREETQKDIDNRYSTLNRLAASKQKDSVEFYVNDFISTYGRSSACIFKLIENYYQVGDIENGNVESRALIEGTSGDPEFLFDDRTDKSIPVKKYIKSTVILLAKKYKQQKIIDLANAKL